MVEQRTGLLMQVDTSSQSRHLAALSYGQHAHVWMSARWLFCGLITQWHLTKRSTTWLLLWKQFQMPEDQIQMHLSDVFRIQIWWSILCFRLGNLHENRNKQKWCDYQIQNAFILWRFADIHKILLQARFNTFYDKPFTGIGADNTGTRTHDTGADSTDIITDGYRHILYIGFNFWV